MSNSEFGLITVQLFLLIALAHLCGHLFTRLRQPRVVGEILAGLLLGPSVLGHFAPAAANLIFPAPAANSAPKQVLRRGDPLLAGQPVEVEGDVSAGDEVAA